MFTISLISFANDAKLYVFFRRKTVGFAENIWPVAHGG